MSMYLNLFLSAIKPISFFLPCSAIIFGSGLSAFDGVVDGVLFSSLLVISILGQITLNLASDYQRAFLSVQKKVSANSSKQNLVRMNMLKLILGSYLLFLVSLILISSLSLEDSIINYFLTGFIALAMLIVIRLKTRTAPALAKAIEPLPLLTQFSLAGLAPSLLAYHLHTASINWHVTVIAMVFSLATLLPYFSERILSIIKAHEPVRSDQLPGILHSTFIWQKSIIAIMVIGVISLILMGITPILVVFSLIAIPSLFATNMTLQHFPETDMALSQKNKVTLATFAFAVLFIVGLMMK